MKQLMKLNLVILMFSVFVMQGQERLSVALFQDAKLLVLGDDDHGYGAGTLNVLARFNMQGKQDRLGYCVVFPAFEYANIEGIYKRYSLGVGYTFNQWLKNSEAGVSLDYGWIDRFGKTAFSASATASYKYKLLDNVKLVALLQLTDRRDLKLFYDTANTLRFSGFVGLEIGF